MIRILRTVGNWAVVGLIVMVAVVGIASHLGLWFRIIDIEGGSMQPTIANGSLLVATRESASTVNNGDVVSTFDRSGNRVTHRVVGRDPVSGGLILRGDANKVDDVTVYTEKSVDRVRVVLPGFGTAAIAVKTFLRNPVLDASLAVLLVVVLWPRSLRISRVTVPRLFIRKRAES